MANRHVAGFVAPAFVRPRKTTARRSGVSYVPSSVRNERSDHSSVTCAGGSRACCCGENMLVCASLGNKNQPVENVEFGWSYGRSVRILCRKKRISLDFRPRHVILRHGFQLEGCENFAFSTNKNSTIKGSSAVDSFKLFPLPSALGMLTWEIDLAAASNRIRSCSTWSGTVKWLLLGSWAIFSRMRLFFPKRVESQ